MTKWRHLSEKRRSLPATVSGPRPGDFPLGSLESRAAARASIIEGDSTGDPTKLTPLELAFSEHEDPGVGQCMLELARTVIQRAEIFGLTLPSVEEIRHANAVVRVANELCDGQFSQICNSNRGEEKRLRQLAEEKLQVRESSSG